MERSPVITNHQSLPATRQQLPFYSFLVISLSAYLKLHLHCARHMSRTRPKRKSPACPCGSATVSQPAQRPGCPCRRLDLLDPDACSCARPDMGLSACLSRNRFSTSAVMALDSASCTRPDLAPSSLSQLLGTLWKNLFLPKASLGLHCHALDQLGQKALWLWWISPRRNCLLSSGLELLLDPCL